MLPALIPSPSSLGTQSISNGSTTVLSCNKAQMLYCTYALCIESSQAKPTRPLHFLHCTYETFQVLTGTCLRHCSWLPQP